MNGNLVKNLTSLTSSYKFSKSFLLTLAIGIIFGFSFAHILLNVTNWERLKFFRKESRNFEHSEEVFKLSKDSYFSFHQDNKSQGKFAL